MALLFISMQEMYLQIVLDKIKENGGKRIVPKRTLVPELVFMQCLRIRRETNWDYILKIEVATISK